MELILIDMEDSRAPYDADNVTEWNAEGMPAGITKDFFLRLGNVSGSTLTIPISITGEHPSRISLSLKEHGAHTDSLIVASLQDEVLCNGLNKSTTSVQ